MDEVSRSKHIVHSPRKPVVPWDCSFCATGQMGFMRSLSSGEIIEQIMYFARLLHQNNKKVTNIVFMGMGEPFHNYENLMACIDRLNDDSGYNFGARRMTISTVGLYLR